MRRAFPSKHRATNPVRRIRNATLRVPNSAYQARKTVLRVPNSVHEAQKTALRVTNAAQEVQDTTFRVPNAGHGVADVVRGVASPVRGVSNAMHRVFCLTCQVGGLVCGVANPTLRVPTSVHGVPGAATWRPIDACCVPRVTCGAMGAVEECACLLHEALGTSRLPLIRPPGTFSPPRGEKGSTAAPDHGAIVATACVADAPDAAGVVLSPCAAGRRDPPPHRITGPSWRPRASLTLPTSPVSSSLPAQRGEGIHRRTGSRGHRGDRVRR